MGRCVQTFAWEWISSLLFAIYVVVIMQVRDSVLFYSVLFNSNSVPVCLWQAGDGLQRRHPEGRAGGPAAVPEGEVSVPAAVCQQ